MLSRVNDFRIIGDGGQCTPSYSGTFQSSYRDVFSTETSSQLSAEVISEEGSRPCAEVVSEEGSRPCAEVSSHSVGGGNGEEGGGEGDEEEEPSPERQSSCEEGKQFSMEMFLSRQQQSALCKVKDLLAQLEEAGSWFPNSSRMVLSHPKCRSTHFGRRVEALTLWHKVVVGLADCLSRLSTWVGVEVTTPTGCLCTPNTVPTTAASDVRFVIGGGERDEAEKNDLVMNSLSFNFSRMHTTR